MASCPGIVHQALDPITGDENLTVCMKKRVSTQVGLMHMPGFSLSSGQLRGLGPSVGARLCSDVVGGEAHAEESVASDGRLGTGDTDGVGSKFGSGVVILSTKQHHPLAEY